MDDRTEREILDRLDHIERYLAQLGAQLRIPYAPYASDPEAFWGPEWADGMASGVNGVDADIVAVARSGRVIEAIKMYRTRTGADLKQAKAAIEMALGDLSSQAEGPVQEAGGVNAVDGGADAGAI